MMNMTMPRNVPNFAAAYLLIAGVAACASDPVSQSQLRESIQRSLPAIEADGVKWMRTQNCISCHNVSFLLWSHNLAKSRGIKIDDAKLGQWTQWTAQKSLAQRGPFEFTGTSLEMLGKDGVAQNTLDQLRPLIGKTFPTQAELLAGLANHLAQPEREQHFAAVLKRTWPTSRPYTTDGGGLDTMAQLLLGSSDLDAHDVSANPSWNELVATTPAMIVAWQEDAGHWKAAGQLPRQNRSAAESDAVATRWAILALAGAPESPERAMAIDRALGWLKKSNESKSNESLVTALLIAHRLGAKAGDEKALLVDLLKHQNVDGGWAWLNDAPSDAFATGQALYALATVDGNATGAESVVRAQQYLLRTQQQDGVWPVTGAGITDAKSTPARMKKVEPIYRQWGTAWAVIGLASTLPEVKTQGMNDGGVKR